MKNKTYFLAFFIHPDDEKTQEPTYYAITLVHPYGHFTRNSQNAFTFVDPIEPRNSLIKFMNENVSAEFWTKLTKEQKKEFVKVVEINITYTLR